ncbi:MAG: triple tyrosine motif-containing protein, partial [Candidatus Poribacteria bacterium]|nr:triple tyrosine motif-containing protein [Candidatus Poribacteria bacterium]
EVTIPTSARLVAFEFHGKSFRTRPEGMVYRYRLVGHNEDWKNTHDHRVEYQDLPIGNYNFEVLAVDRDLVYSEPASVMLTITD